MKQCSKCKQMLPESAFSKCAKVKSGLSSACKACDVKRVQAYKRSLDAEARERLRDYQQSYNREYWQKNRDELSAKNMEYKAQNRDAINEMLRDYYQNNKEKFYEQRAAYRKANRGKVNNWVIMRRKMLQQRTFPAQKEAINEFYQQCPKGYHVDHMVPLTHPLVCGLHVIANLQYLPARENSSKRNKFEIGE